MHFQISTNVSVTDTYIYVVLAGFCKKTPVVLGRACHGLTGEFLLLRIFSVAISVGPHVCFISDLIFIFMFL